MVESGFEGIGTYVTRRQNTVAQYIATQPILNLCEWYARRPEGVGVSEMVGTGRFRFRGGK